MEDVRCKCGKIISQLENEVVIIKCRHCKRLVILRFSNQTGDSKASLTKVSRPKIEYK